MSVWARLRAGRQPHFVREYRNLTRFLERRTMSELELAERAVGGSYDEVGARQAKIVREYAPAAPWMLVDVGCGSGRTAAALKQDAQLSYLGTDVVPSLLEFARKKAGRPDWRFETVTSLDIPEANACADVVLFMSVFTHLRRGEIDALIREAHRVLKPGGVVIASYLDSSRHRNAYRPPWRQTIWRLLGRDVMITFTTEAELGEQLRRAGFEVVRYLEDTFLGQCVLIGRK
jgi:ubiquinone/menaquinone biosynthesis C-methylase UbiE